MLSLLMPPAVMETVKTSEADSVCFAEEFKVGGRVGGPDASFFCVQFFIQFFLSRMRTSL